VREFQTEDSDLGPLFDWLTDEQTPSANILRQHSLDTRNLWGQYPAVHLSDGMLVRKLYDSDAVKMIVYGSHCSTSLILVHWQLI